MYEMDIGGRGEWGARRMRTIWKGLGRLEKSGLPILLIQLVTICHQLIH